MKRILLISAGLCMFGLSAPCHAQTSDYETAILGQSMEARIGVTIPFGGDGTSKKSKPQLALIGRRTNGDRYSADWAMKPGAVQNDYVETRLALTLSAEPELRLNDREIYSFEKEQANVSDDVKTAGKIALGIGLVTLAAAVLVVGIFLVTYDGDGT